MVLDLHHITTSGGNRMSQISQKTNKSAVKIVIKIFMAVGLLSPTFSASVSFATAEDIAQKCASQAGLTENGQRACIERETAKEESAAKAKVEKAKALIQAKKDAALTCTEATKLVSTTSKDLNKSCSEAGLGKDCAEKATACADASGEEPQDSITALTEAAGLGQYSAAIKTATAGNKSKDEEGNSCAKYSGKDYYETKKKSEEDLDKVAEDLAKLTEEKAKLQKDFAKELQDIQESVTKAQEELEAQKLKIKDSKRERIANFQNTQNQQKDQLRQKNMSILKIKGDIINSDRDKAMKLVALTDASGKRTCMNEYNKARASYQKTSTSSTSNHLASASAKKKDVIAVYTDCIAIFQQQRVALNESKKQEMDTLNAQLANLQSEVDDLTGNMELSANQLNEMETDAATEQSQAEQKVIKFMQTAQQKMLSAQQELTTNVQALTQKETALKTKQNRINNSLMTMGPIPKSRSSKSTAVDVVGEVESLSETLADAKKAQKEACSSTAAAKAQKEVETIYGGTGNK